MLKPRHPVENVLVDVTYSLFDLLAYVQDIVSKFGPETVMY